MNEIKTIECLQKIRTAFLDSIQSAYRLGDVVSWFNRGINKKSYFNGSFNRTSQALEALTTEKTELLLGAAAAAASVGELNAIVFQHVYADEDLDSAAAKDELKTAMENLNKISNIL